MDRIVKVEPARLVLRGYAPTVIVTHNEPPQDWWKWTGRASTVVGLGRFIWDVLSSLFKDSPEPRTAD